MPHEGCQLHLSHPPPSRVYNRGHCTLGPMKPNYRFPATYVMPCFLSWRSWRLTSSDVNRAPRHQTFVRGPERKVTFTVVRVEQNSVQEVPYVIILGCTPGSDHSNVRCLGDPYLCPRYPYLGHSQKKGTIGWKKCLEWYLQYFKSNNCTVRLDMWNWQKTCQKKLFQYFRYQNIAYRSNLTTKMSLPLPVLERKQKLWLLEFLLYP